MPVRHVAGGRCERPGPHSGRCRGHSMERGGWPRRSSGHTSAPEPVPPDAARQGRVRLVTRTVQTSARRRVAGVVFNRGESTARHTATRRPRWAGGHGRKLLSSARQGNTHFKVKLRGCRSWEPLSINSRADHCLVFSMEAEASQTTLKNRDSEFKSLTFQKMRPN